MIGSDATDREPADDADILDDRTLLAARRAEKTADDTVLSRRRGAVDAGADPDPDADADTVGVTRRPVRDAEADETAVSARGRGPAAAPPPVSAAPLAGPDGLRPTALPVVGRAALPVVGRADLPGRADRVGTERVGQPVEDTVPHPGREPDPGGPPAPAPVDGNALERARRRLAARRLAAIAFVAASVVLLSAAVLAALLPAL